MTEPGGALDILLIEDVATEAEIIGRQLRRDGLVFSLRHVTNEADFHAELLRAAPDVILADFNVPGADGLALVDLARPIAPEVPFIMVSGSVGEHYVVEALRRGATDYITKQRLTQLEPAIRRALQERRDREAKHAAEQLVRDLVETSQDWIWQADAEGRYTYSSPAVRLVLGYEPEQLVGRHFAEFLHPDDRDLSPSLLPNIDGFQLPLRGGVARWLHRTGATVWLERNALAVHAPGGALLGFRGADRDITLRWLQEERLRRLNRLHRMLSAINTAIVRSPSREDLLREACRIAVELGGYDRAVISQVDSGTAVQRPVAVAGLSGDALDNLQYPLPEPEPDPSGASLFGRAIRELAPMYTNDLAAETRPVQARDVLLAMGLSSLAVFPLLVDGTAIGTLTLSSRQPGMIDDVELRELREIAANLGFALHHFDREEKVEYLSYFDVGTGLPKRTLFCERLARRLQSAADVVAPMMFVVFDVQRISQINDAYGRHCGDRLLALVADRMRRSTPPPAAVASLGGGTFAMALDASELQPDSGLFRSSVADPLFDEPFIVDDIELKPAIRSGIAMYPDDGRTPDTVLQNAEAALKHARVHGDRTVHYARIGHAPSGRLAFESRLARALQKQEFVLHYQPQYRLEDGCISGLEALLRWQPSEGPLVPPAEFIELLEETGQIVEVGQWVLEQAVRDCRRFSPLLPDGIRIAVNVSPLQLRRREFTGMVTQAISMLDRSREGIELEITESMLIRDLEGSMQTFEPLRAAGVRVAIDDFGTGYSSLRALSKLPVDTLKIDRDFVRATADAPGGVMMVATIISLARAFGMQTVAEGVETAAQQETLRGLGCDHVQGYLLSRPLPAEQVPALLERNAESRPRRAILR